MLQMVIKLVYFYCYSFFRPSSLSFQWLF